MKPMKWILATGFVCGAALFTACSDDSSSSPAPKAPPSENHAAFVEQTREDLKVLAQNLNFTSWEYANEMNMYFNEYVLLNDDFQKSIMSTISSDIQESLTPVEKGSELAKLGYESYFTMDYGQIKKQFTMNEDGTGFDVKDADNFEMVISGYNTETKKVEQGMYKLTIKTDGEAGRLIAKKVPVEAEGLAVVVIIPETVKFDIAVKSNKKWNTLYKGEFTNTVKLNGKSEFVDRLTSNMGVEGSIISSVPMLNEKGKVTGTDSTKLKFKLAQDSKADQGTLAFSYEHNGKKMLDLSGAMTNSNGAVDLEKFTSSNSVFDVFTAMMTGNSLDELKMTLLDKLTLEVKVSDVKKLIEVQTASAEARRFGTSDEKTTQDYAEKINDLVTAKLTSKSTKQKMDVKFEAVKFGIDYWTMPAVKFSDEKEYVPVVDLLDQQSIMYGINIVDHAVAPLSDAIVVARQLMQYLQMLTGEYNQKQGTASKDEEE
jgi:hypothetical protein